MPLPGFIGKLFSGGASELVTSIKGVISEFHMSPEESAKLEQDLLKVTNDHVEKMATLAQQETDSYLKDTQDARSSFTRIQESDKASWMAKNMLPILASGVTLGFFGLLFYMLKYDVPPENKDILNIMLGALGTAWIGVMNYFFGSSSGSKIAGDSIRKIAESK